jgi:hypothetical protein
VKCQDGKKYTVPYVVYEKTWPCTDYPHDGIVTFTNITAECDGVDCAKDIQWEAKQKVDHCAMTAHINDNNISITWDYSLPSKYDALSREELYHLNHHGAWATAALNSRLF